MGKGEALGERRHVVAAGLGGKHPGSMEQDSYPYPTLWAIQNRALDKKAVDKNFPRSDVRPALARLSPKRAAKKTSPKPAPPESTPNLHLAPSWSIPGSLAILAPSPGLGHMGSILTSVAGLPYPHRMRQKLSNFPQSDSRFLTMGPASSIRISMRASGTRETHESAHPPVP